jgi:four helix bundle protein
MILESKKMKIIAFEDLIAWQKAQDVAEKIYKNFNTLNDFGFRDQICRASISISNNIAEGFDRYSKKEFIRFLYISKGSCSEVKSMLYLAKRLNFANEQEIISLQELCEETSKIIRGLMKFLGNNEQK